MSTDAHPLRDVLREVEWKFHAMNEPTVGDLSLAIRLARELRVLAPLLRHHVEDKPMKWDEIDFGGGYKSDDGRWEIAKDKDPMDGSRVWSACERQPGEPGPGTSPFAIINEFRTLREAKAHIRMILAAEDAATTLVAVVRHAKDMDHRMCRSDSCAILSGMVNELLDEVEAYRAGLRAPKKK